MRGKYVVNPKFSHQMRAISSPSLSEQPLDAINVPATLTTSGSGQRTAEQPSHSNIHAAPGSVLQKLKNTFSQLKGKSSSSATASNAAATSANSSHTLSTSSAVAAHQSAATVTNNSNNNHNSSGHNDSTTYRFGPLVWRTSKERRKTKSHRRDKCNSGDSGIQVELDGTDEPMLPTSEHGLDRVSPAAHTITSLPPAASASHSPYSASSVRRANSAKVASSTSAAAAAARAKLRRKGSERIVRSLSVRSQSQPTGLDSMSRAPVSGHRKATATAIMAADDHSDSDSEDYTNASSPHHQYYHHHHHHLDSHAQPAITYAEVLYTFRPASDQELALEQGALIEVLHREPGPWWWGRVKHDAVLAESQQPAQNGAEDATIAPVPPAEGWFPKDFVRPIVPLYVAPSGPSTRLQRQRFVHVAAAGAARQPPVPPPTTESPFAEATNCDIRLAERLVVNSPQAATPSFKRAASESPPSVSPRPTSAQSSELIRLNVIKELLDTEVNYVKLLAALCNGYLKELRLRPEVFAADSLAVIFSNIEQIWQFQQGFLNALRLAVIQNRIAETFVEYQTGFMVYSVYCNSYTRALMELDTYTGNPLAATLLESCRIAQNLPELPLSAHLLAPIQRICRYPLHLIELVKHTAPGGSAADAKESLEMALAAMKHVTEMVNEGKRHSEYLGRIQARFDNFQGAPISAHSTRLFLQTDAIRMTPNLWNNTYTLFLFDHQLVYCKKDLLKRTTYTYKGRIFLDSCRILNLPDGKIFGLTLKNALRIYCDLRGKWFDFCFRSASSKLRFLSTLAAERKFSGHSLFVSELAGGGGNDTDDGGDDGGMMTTATEYVAAPRSINFGATEAEMAGNSHGNSGADLQAMIVERAVDVENAMNVANTRVSVASAEASDESQQGSKTQQLNKQRGDTLPKKSRKLHKEQTSMVAVASAAHSAAAAAATAVPNGYAEYNSSSLGRKRIGNWFRKARSTNTTPSHSPTHHGAVHMAASIPAAAASAATLTTGGSVSAGDISIGSASVDETLTTVSAVDGTTR